MPTDKQDNSKLAVRVQLGSTLLAAAEAKTAILGGLRNVAGREKIGVSTGLTQLDVSALGGEGLRNGEITSVAATGDGGERGRTLLLYHLISSHLLSASNKTHIAYIDTLGAFSPQHLLNALTLRLLQRARWSASDSQSSPQKREEVIHEATDLLGRVKLMRVFDLAGIAEAVGEISTINSPSAPPTAAQPEKVVSKRTEVLDSEDEDGDEASSPFATHQNPPTESTSTDQNEDKKIGLIIIDALPPVLNTALSRHKISAQALLSSLLLSLHHLTKHHNICTVLTNSYVTSSSVPNANSYNAIRRRLPEDDVSAFSATMGKPALGKFYAEMVDSSLLMSVLPKEKEDAVRLYGEDGLREWSKAYVLEVLRDRHGGREGLWGAFEVRGEDEMEMVGCYNG